MKPYSEDLRTRIVRALQEEGTAKSAAARLFGVSLSSVKRYARIASRGESLKSRKGGGRPPKTDETTQKLLEEDVKERPAAAVSERRRFLEHTTGKVLSDSTVLRLLKRMGFSQKTDCGDGGARRVAESRLEGGACLENRPEAARLRGRDGHEHLAFGAARLVATRTKGLLLGASQSGIEHHAAFEHDDGGHGPVPSGGGHDDYWRGLRSLCRAGCVPRAVPWADRGDGQPQRP